MQAYNRIISKDAGYAQVVRYTAYPPFEILHAHWPASGPLFLCIGLAIRGNATNCQSNTKNGVSYRLYVVTSCADDNASDAATGSNLARRTDVGNGFP